jgi:hypothetical protein
MRTPSPRLAAPLAPLALLLLSLGCSDSAVAPSTAGLEADKAPTFELHYDQRLDLADEQLESGALLLLAAQNPAADKPDRPFGGHREKAVELIRKAQEEIQKARIHVSDPKNQANQP